MISKLLKKLADLPGINVFNHKDKMEFAIDHEPKKFNVVANGTMNYHELRLQNERYFEHITTLKTALSAAFTLINTFDEEVKRWDEIQAKHEGELEDMRRLMLSSKVGQYISRIQELEAKNSKLQKQLATERARRPIISEDNIKELRQLAAEGMSVASKSTYRHIMRNFEGLAKKLEVEMKKQGMIDGAE